MLRKLLKAIVWASGAVLLYAAVLATEWLPRPDSGETAALVTLREPLPPVPAGRNAYTVYWFLYHDIGARDPEALMRSDARRLATAAADGNDFAPLEGAEPDQDELDVEAYCPLAPDSCLDFVRPLTGQGRAELEGAATVLQRLDTLHEATHFRYPFRAQDPLQFPRLAGTMKLTRLAAASRFVRGDERGGFVLACRDLATWRRLAPTTDLLISGMVAASWQLQHAHLVSEMLAEWPPDAPLPAPCDVALAPVAASEKDHCDMWRGEFRYIEAMAGRRYAALRGELPEPWNELPAPTGDLLYNERAAVARVAPEFAIGCGVPAGPAAGNLDVIDRLFDPVGSAEFAADESRSNQNYREWLEDATAAIQAVRLQAHLRDAADLPAALASLPADLTPVPDIVTIDPTARTITVAFRQPESDPDTWILRLPPRSLPDAPPAG